MKEATQMTKPLQSHLVRTLAPLAANRRKAPRRLAVLEKSQRVQSIKELSTADQFHQEVHSTPQETSMSMTSLESEVLKNKFGVASTINHPTSTVC